MRRATLWTPLLSPVSVASPVGERLVAGRVDAGGRERPAVGLGVMIVRGAIEGEVRVSVGADKVGSGECHVPSNFAKP